MVIVLENEEYGSVIGSRQAPFINDVANRYATATNAYGTAHPSLPNYLALISGSTQGVTSDCTSCQGSGPTLAAQLTEHGIPWSAYMENMPSPCYTDPSAPGGYAKKHNPFVYFPTVTGSDQCQHVVPADRLISDLTSTAPPAFVWLTPNLCNDGHDCGIATADQWLRTTMARVLSTPWYAADNGVVIITWDEGASSASCCQRAEGGRIATVVVAESLHGVRHDQPVDHAGILRTIEDVYGLPPLGDAACACSGNLHPLL